MRQILLFTVLFIQCLAVVSQNIATVKDGDYYDDFDKTSDYYPVGMINDKIYFLENGKKMKFILFNLDGKFEKTIEVTDNSKKDKTLEFIHVEMEEEKIVFYYKKVEKYVTTGIYKAICNSQTGTLQEKELIESMGKENSLENDFKPKSEGEEIYGTYETSSGKSIIITNDVSKEVKYNLTSLNHFKFYSGKSGDEYDINDLPANNIVPNLYCMEFTDSLRLFVYSDIDLEGMMESLKIYGFVGKNDRIISEVIDNISLYNLYQLKGYTQKEIENAAKNKNEIIETHLIPMFYYLDELFNYHVFFLRCYFTGSNTLAIYKRGEIIYNKFDNKFRLLEKKYFVRDIRFLMQYYFEGLAKYEWNDNQYFFFPNSTLSNKFPVSYNEYKKEPDFNHMVIKIDKKGEFSEEIIYKYDFKEEYKNDQSAYGHDRYPGLNTSISIMNDGIIYMLCFKQNQPLLRMVKLI